MEPQKIIKGSYTMDKNAKITSRPRNLGASLTSLRASSKGEPKESLGETTNPYSSNLIPLAEDENAFASKIKLDITKIQEEINKLDIDGKIRNPSNLELKKNYISVIQKWLVKNADPNIKETLENKIGFNPDPEKLVEVLNVKSPEEGLRKMFKLFSLVELQLTKMSELQMVTLVKYDENFSSFIKTSAFNQVNQLTAGINLNRFPIFLINLERFIELLNFTNKLASDVEIKSHLTKGKSQINLINSKEELLEGIKNQELRLFPDEAAILNKILKESIEKEKQLNEEIESLMLKIGNSSIGESEKTKNLKENSKHVRASNDPNYYIRIIDEVRDLFKEEIQRYEVEIKDLSSKLNESRYLIEDMKSKLGEVEQKLTTLKEEKKKVIEGLNKNSKNKHDEDRFEDVLREEFTNMQIGFEAKIENLTEQIANIRKEKGREVLEMKQVLSREIETKNLLMKKLSTFINY